jgi:hypothetical protein
MVSIYVQTNITCPFFELLTKGKHRGYLTLSPRLIMENERVNIVQHADGRPLQVVMTQNYVVKNMSKTRVQYVADTMDGSSGSPVFNQNWEIVALHHSGNPYPRDSLANELKRAWKGPFSSGPISARKIAPLSDFYV